MRHDSLFTASELVQLRQLIRTHDERGVLHEQHRVLDQVRERLERRTGLTLIPETFLVRLFPGANDGLAVHVDLDYVLQHLQDPDICLACGRQSTQRGLHWTKKCKKPPPIDRSSSIVAIVVNVGNVPGSIVSLGPECRVGRNNSGGIVPIVTSRQKCRPVDLQPGEVLQFSPWTINEISASSLDEQHISLHVFALVT